MWSQDKGMTTWVLKVKQFKYLLAAVGVIIVLMVMFGRGGNSTKPESIRKKRPLDVTSLSIDDPSLKPLLTKTGLRPIKTRGSTIFVDESGNTRVPPPDVLEKMEFRDLEELYHRYVESIQTICKQQVHLGSLMDGGYDLCQDEEVAPAQPCIAYSFGVRTDFSFDEQLNKIYGCEVHSFDPANGMKDHKHSENIYFHSMGLDATNNIKNDNWKMRTAETIKTELGHANKKINIMKIDIEAGEWPAIPEMISSGVLKDVKQLIVEFHSWVDLPPWNIDGRNKHDYREHLSTFRQLYDEGFRIFYFKRFPANCCVYDDEFGIQRTGCHEVHLMRVAT